MDTYTTPPNPYERAPARPEVVRATPDVSRLTQEVIDLASPVHRTAEDEPTDMNRTETVGAAVFEAAQQPEVALHHPEVLRLHGRHLVAHRANRAA